jgi:hypothetical protein
VWGEELYFDCTKVQANASIKSMIDRVEFETQEHLGHLFESIEKILLPLASWSPSTLANGSTVSANHIINGLQIAESALRVNLRVKYPACSRALFNCASSCTSGTIF